MCYFCGVGVLYCDEFEQVIFICKFGVGEVFEFVFEYVLFVDFQFDVFYVFLCCFFLFGDCEGVVYYQY